jgi:hypothetical protein
MDFHFSYDLPVVVDALVAPRSSEDVNVLDGSSYLEKIFPEMQNLFCEYRWRSLEKIFIQVKFTKFKHDVVGCLVSDRIFLLKVSKVSY